MNEDCKPLPHEVPETQQKDNKTNYNTMGLVILFTVGIVVGIVIILIAITNNTSDKFYTNETCQELINNSTMLAYNTGLFDIINYTSSTGAIKIIYNNTVVDSNVCEYCDYLVSLNEEVSNGR